MPGDQAGQKPWLVIDPMVERAILIALLCREGGQLTMTMDEILAATDTTWTLEGFRSPEDPDTVRLRLRRHDGLR